MTGNYMYHTWYFMYRKLHPKTRSKLIWRTNVQPRAKIHENIQNSRMARSAYKHKLQRTRICYTRTFEQRVKANKNKHRICTSQKLEFDQKHLWCLCAPYFRCLNPSFKEVNSEAHADHRALLTASFVKVGKIVPKIKTLVKANLAPIPLSWGIMSLICFEIPTKRVHSVPKHHQQQQSPFQVTRKTHHLEQNCPTKNTLLDH